MAHSCPTCGQCCYCGGDIDDCCLDEPQASAHCYHCDVDDDGTEGLDFHFTPPPSSSTAPLTPPNPPGNLSP